MKYWIKKEKSSIKKFKKGDNDKNISLKEV